MDKLKNPFSREKEPINYDIYERFLSAFDPHALASQIYEDVKKRINKNLESATPELLVNFNSLYQELSIAMGEYQKIVHTIEKKSKKLFESSSLTEDVYKLRDEFKMIKKKVDKLNSGLRGLFRLSVEEEESK